MFRRCLCPVSYNGMPQLLPLRERLKNVYFVFFGPKTNRVIVIASLFLLLISFFSSEWVMTLWYHIAEGLLTFLFVSEIGLRLAVMRNNFWESAFNVSEAVACVICLTIFFILHFSRQHASLAEHRVLIVLRYLGQLLRMAGLVASDSANLLGYDNGIQLFAGNGVKHFAADPRDGFRDVL
ncbi:uncharacterized protein TM35_000031140 [Trypanosoma theileri]|uniref:Uncharacterized protein n=1 Tax=Trypanosoma theileri TaxID=67003 RepID=A0A1X0P6B3_9TRYP|nr:uncharacterized protein TM35_000031140 [Trypanosoma theileri]ORC92361.1 hypothetical protein TM35_000031140 [Trypanosoma theileri]